MDGKIWKYIKHNESEYFTILRQIYSFHVTIFREHKDTTLWFSEEVLLIHNRGGHNYYTLILGRGLGSDIWIPGRPHMCSNFRQAHACVPTPDSHMHALRPQTATCKHSDPKQPHASALTPDRPHMCPEPRQVTYLLWPLAEFLVYT